MSEVVFLFGFGMILGLVFGWIMCYEYFKEDINKREGESK